MSSARKDSETAKNKNGDKSSFSSRKRVGGEATLEKRRDFKNKNDDLCKKTISRVKRKENLKRKKSYKSAIQEKKRKKRTSLENEDVSKEKEDVSGGRERDISSEKENVSNAIERLTTLRNNEEISK